jgi:glycosyltransferase involved in cell wall biosynthesis
MRVLAVGDCASVMSTLAKHLNYLDMIAPYASSPVFIETASNSTTFFSPKGFFKSINLKKDYDLLHASTIFGIAYSYISYKLFDIPFGIHFHGSDLRILSGIKKPNIKQHYLIPTCLQAIKKARYILVSTPDLLPLAKKLRTDVSYLPNPIDLRKFSPSGPKHHFTDSTSPILFSPSRIGIIKGTQIINESLKILSSDNIKFNAYQIEWFDKEVLNIKHLFQSSFVSYIDLINRENMSDYYRGSDIILGQAKTGALSNIELEAAACKTPVIVYDKRQETPFSPKVSSSIEYYKELKKMLTDFDYRNYVANAQYDFVKQHHDSIKIAKRFEDIFKDNINL